jgi:hypothetical protein
MDPAESRLIRKILIKGSVSEVFLDGGAGGFFLEPSAPLSFNEDLSNEQSFGRIDFAG